MQSESAEQRSFWLGFEMALAGWTPRLQNEFIWSGWSYGVMEKTHHWDALEKMRRKKKRFIN